MLVSCLEVAVEFVLRGEYDGHRGWNVLMVTVEVEGEV
jgi:hypothetical protein